MKKIGVIGEALIDRYNDKKQIGGASFNVVCSVAAQKNEAYFLGSISTDEDGKMIEKELTKYGVKPDFVERTDVPTTFSQVLLDKNNDRTFTFSRTSDAIYDINKFDMNKMNFDFVHFGSATGFLPGNLNTSYFKLKNHCVKDNIPYSFDPNYRDALWANLDVNDFIKQAKEFLKDAAVGKVSDYELTLITGIEDEMAALNAMQKMVKDDCILCITRGEKDTLVTYKGQTWTVPVNAVKPVDTTGAGDAFASRMVDLYNETKEFNKDTITNMVQEANNYAAQAVEYVGALTYLNK